MASALWYVVLSLLSTLFYLPTWSMSRYEDVNTMSSVYFKSKITPCLVCSWHHLVWISLNIDGSVMRSQPCLLWCLSVWIPLCCWRWIFMCQPLPLPWQPNTCLRRSTVMFLLIWQGNSSSDRLTQEWCQYDWTNLTSVCVFDAWLTDPCSCVCITYITVLKCDKEWVLLFIVSVICSIYY